MDLDLATARLPERISYRHALLVALASVVATWTLTAITFIFLPRHPDIMERMLGPLLFMVTVIPLAVGFPVGVILQRGRVKLAKTLRALEEAHGELSRRSRIDPLTGLLNREAFLSVIEEQREAGIRGAMLMIDIDYFKLINDTFGHHAGDDALKLIAAALNAGVHEGDIIGRLGGEEFGIFVPCESIEPALAAAERIRSHVSVIAFRPARGRSHSITASIGVSFDGASLPLSDMLKRADTSLYDAKESGRNRIVVHEAA